MAYDRLEPIGARRTDILFAHLCSVIYNVARMTSGSKDAKVLDIADFLLQWWSTEEKGESTNLEAKAAMIFGAFGGSGAGGK